MAAQPRLSLNLVWVSLCFLGMAAIVADVSRVAASEENGTAKADDQTPQLPGYRLKVGQVLVYESSLVYAGRPTTYGTRDTVWVVAQNDDGSSRLIVRHQDWSERPAAEGNAEQERQSLDETLAYLDLHPDGSFERNPSFGYRFDPISLFPPVPRDNAAVANGWNSKPDPYGNAYKYEVKAAPDDRRAVWEFRGERTGTTNQVYEVAETVDVRFDGQVGRVAQIERHSTEARGVEPKADRITKLISVETADLEWLAMFRAEAERYFTAAAKFRAIEKQSHRDFAHAEELMTAALEVLQQLRSESTLAEVTNHIDAMLANQQRYSEYALQDARKFQALIGQPSEDWQLEDLEGNVHALTDYRGRVVLLDFWYRGCGWCIRAMPQIKQVVEKFADQPVTVIGMNTDSELENATFVEKVMALNYASLQARGIPEKYEVTGFPALVILDRQGRIRDFHVGYAGDLFEQVSASVERLLAEPLEESEEQNAVDADASAPATSEKE